MIESFLVGIGSSLTGDAIKKALSGEPTFFQQKRIDARVDEIVTAVMEPMAEFFRRERIPDQTIELLVQEANQIVDHLLSNSDIAAKNGLNTEAITRELINSPQGMQSLGHFPDYPEAFERVVRALVDLAVTVPPAFKDWEKAAFGTLFRQTEDIKVTLSSVYEMMQQVTSRQRKGGSKFEKITNHMAATTALRVNIHGLRQSPVPQRQLDNLFVFPQFFESKVGLDSDNERLQEPEYFNDSREFLSTFSADSRLVILAPAGAGKTTFSDWLASALLTEENPRLVLVLPLRKTIKLEELPSIKQAVDFSVPAVLRDIITTDDVESWAEEGLISVIFKGFDEINELDRGRVLEWIDGISNLYPNVSIVITSRPLSTPHLDNLVKQNKWRDLRLAPFDLKRVSLYIERFQKYGPEIQTGAERKAPEKLANLWLSDSTIGPLTGNPLLLSTLLIVHHMDGELPDDRSKLYDRYIDGMLGLWEFHKELSTPSVSLTKDQKKKILSIIAINMIEKETDAASEYDVEIWLRDYIRQESIQESVPAILNYLRERSGLLIGPGQYTFAHKSIGEFLVAQACNNGIQRSFNGYRFDRKLIEEKCLHDRWTTVIFLWSGIAATLDVQEFIDRQIKIGNIGLAGGLMHERRKFLDREWIKASFWRIVKYLVELDRDKEFHETANVRIGFFDIVFDEDYEKSFPLFQFTSISNSFFYEPEFIKAFIVEDFISANDWKYHLNYMNVVTWETFLSVTQWDDQLIAIEPEELTTEKKDYILAKSILSTEEVVDDLEKRVSYTNLDSLLLAIISHYLVISLYYSKTDDLFISEAAWKFIRKIYRIKNMPLPQKVLQFLNKEVKPRFRTQAASSKGGNKVRITVGEQCIMNHKNIHKNEMSDDIKDFDEFVMEIISDNPTNANMGK